MENIQFGILPKLTKDYVFNFVTQADIFSKYFGISNSVIENCAQNNTLICNPLRRDNYPTLGFKYLGNRLRAKDFNGYFWGDCFDLIAFIHKLDTEKQDFLKILDIICRDFNLHKYEGAETVELDLSQISYTFNSETKKKQFKKIKFIPRLFNKIDLEYWNQFYFTTKDLERFNIIPCAYVSLGEDVVYDYSDNYDDVAYCYDFGVDISGERKRQIYFPKRKKNRFLLNFSGLLGYNNAEPKDFLIITKSYKDVCAGRKIVGDDLPIEFVATSSETYLIQEDEYMDLWSNYKYIFTLMDFDFTGRRLAHQFSKRYNMPPLFLTNGKRGTKIDYKAKDISEYLNKHNIDKTFNLISNSFDAVKKKYGI